MKISCIIPTLNEEVNVRKFLDGYLTQTLKFHELIFVDGNSKDKTREIIQDHIKNNPEIKLVICNKKGPAAARNKGLDHSTGDYVTFFDADTKFTSNKTIEKMKKYLGNYEVTIFWIDTNNTYNGFKKYLHYKEKLTGIAVIKRDLCPKWDEELGFGEDRLFPKEYIKNNYEIIKVNENEISISKTKENMNLKKIIKRYMWYGRTIPKYLKKSKDWKYGIGYIIYIISIIPIFWFIPFLRGFVNGIKYLKEGVDIPFGMGLIEILTSIGTSLGFMQWLIGIKDIGRDIQ